MMTVRAAAPPRPEPLADVGRALVVGLGASGRAAAALLATAGVEVVVAEADPDHPAADAARTAGHEVVLAGDPRDLLDRVQLVVPSPGVPEHAPVLVAAAGRGLPVWSEPELAWRLHPRELLAVTGTNGKTTTTELLAAMVRAGGRDAVACGNIGLPLSEAAAASGGDVLVAELSSFQLRFAGTLRPRVGVLLNLAADHLDWHADLAAYGAAKARLWEAQDGDDWAVANADDPHTLQLLEARAPARRATFSTAGPVDVGVGLEGGALVARFPDDVPPSGEVVGLDELERLGLGAPHQVANVAAAACAALLARVAPAAVREAVRAHRPGRHRHEVVARTRDGVTFIDDSKATNVHAAAAALKTGRSVVWIAGGLSKGVDLRPLADELGTVRHAVLIGTAAGELAAVCERAGVPARQAASIEDAVAIAADLAAPDDTVLLAPACASFDQFRDYAERGERFAAAARAAAAARGSADRDDEEADHGRA